MNIEKLRELNPGDDVTVITTGNFSLVDVASQLRFPPLAEVSTKLTPFVENQLRQGNLTLVGEDDAPEAKGDAVKAEDLTYSTADSKIDTSRTTDAKPKINQELISTSGPAKGRGRRSENAEPTQSE